MIEPSEVLAAVDARAPVVGEVMRFIHEHPELGHEEYECSRYLCDVLVRVGFAVEVGAGGMPTAFRAVLRGEAGDGPGEGGGGPGEGGGGRGEGGGGPGVGGSGLGEDGGGRCVGVVCLYDAVPATRPDGTVEAVHSCGHGPISGGVVAAAAALADLRDRLGGSVVVIGCPADEIHAPGTIAVGGGKALSVETGLWDGIDAALYAHPEFVNTVSQESLWMRRCWVTQPGTRSLSGGEQVPLGTARAALEVERPGEVMLERLVVDGDVEQETGLIAQATFLIWGSSEEEVGERARVVRESVPGDWQEGRLYQGVRPNPELTEAVAQAFGAFGQPFVSDPPPLPFATDFGNISRCVPAALIGVGRDGGWAFHTDEGAEQFASSDGEEAGLAVARVLALTAARVAG